MLPAITHVGTFGQFRWAGKPLVETWLALEAVAKEYDWWAGIYSQENLLDYGKRHGILTAKEVKMFRDAMDGVR